MRFPGGEAYLEPETPSEICSQAISVCTFSPLCRISSVSPLQGEPSFGQPRHDNNSGMASESNPRCSRRDRRLSLLSLHWVQNRLLPDHQQSLAQHDLRSDAWPALCRSVMSLFPGQAISIPPIILSNEPERTSRSLPSHQNPGTLPRSESGGDIARLRARCGLLLQCEAIYGTRAISHPFRVQNDTAVMIGEVSGTFVGALPQPGLSDPFGVADPLGLAAQ